MSRSSSQGRRITIRGIVQGVGFRPWVYRAAASAAVTGRVRNDHEGVSIEAFGSSDALETFLRHLQLGLPSAARVDELRWEAIPFETADSFTIVRSEKGDARHVSIPPDLATCGDCLREVFDPRDRRHRYAFTNCTNCGPRFTIAADVPYDRATTTMRSFAMCAACLHEYEDVRDRRFHAEPNACPSCGPRLELVGPGGTPVSTADPLRAAADALRAGRIVAVKGLGGFHLACDATSAAAVRRLRERKRREQKPLAVMVRDLAAADALAVIGHQEMRLLQSIERPIVLAWRRGDARLPREIAPDGGLLGLFLPYTALHHLLLGDCGVPLVMTSGNLSEEPIAYRNDEALARLDGVADLWLLHDREIVTRCDDSVATVVSGGPTVIRRSRGYVPRPVRLARALPRTVLGTGAQLKNTFCLAAGREAWFGPHIGDLENLETFESFRESIDRMERFLGITPEVVAHDLHPDYLSTNYANARPGVARVAVQHHHAHLASAMAEAGLEGRVIGVVFDGTGYGPDGTAWGGEVLVGDWQGYERAATCHPIRLAGADVAIRQPWRQTLALLDETFEGDPPLDALPLFRGVPARDVQVVRRLIADGLHAPLARGMGRYFDVFGALVLGRGTAAFEGQIAYAFHVIADPAERSRYEWDVRHDGELAVLDLRPALRQAAFEVIGDAPPEVLSARFHNTLAAATADLVRGAARVHGRLPVVLTGGCFQNARLADSIAAELGRPFAVHVHRAVPPGDGGIALGQAVVGASAPGG